MDFFKSILSDDPDPSQKIHESEPNPPTNPSNNEIQEENDAANDQLLEKPNPNSSADSGNGGWSFGGLVKTFATRSESMLETYRRDLQEFGSGLKKETEIIREVASRAVNELPASIEVGAGSVTHAFDGVLKSTADIISQGKETLLASSSSDVESDASRVSGSSGRYSRFDARLSVLQNDVNTYCEEADDFEEYKKWKSEFDLEEKSGEIGNLIGENGVLEGVYKRVVPNLVDSESFWFRYFYRVNKLKQQESMRVNLVKRAISIDDEEELSWDVDDDNDESLDVPTSLQNVSSEAVDVKGESKSKEDIVDEVKVVVEKAISEESSELKDEDKVVKKVDEEVSSEGKGEVVDKPLKDSDVSIISSQPSIHEEEEDLGWDEIENIGSDDDKKDNSIARGGSANGTDLRKRLSGAEEDEDLSWDIEDDDEPVKA